MTDTDIVIVGGGTVGSLIARGLLARTDFHITLIDAHAFRADQSHPGFDARVIALANRSVDELAELGVYPDVSDAVPIHHIQVSDQGAAGLCQLDAAEFGLAEFGRVIALTDLGQALQMTQPTARLNVIAPATVVSIERSQEKVDVTLEDGRSMSARLLILADGGRSCHAAELGLQSHTEDYQQTAIITNVQTSERHNNRAYERFTPCGPLAFLPFSVADPQTPSGKVEGFSVVWTVPPGEAENLMQASEQAFLRQLQNAFGYRHGIIHKVGARSSYPLALRTTEPAISHRVLVAGNAAQTLHPIAGQGFNLGLRDAVTLMKVLSDAADPGAFSVLHQYAGLRQQDRRHTISLTDSLVRLFSNRHWPLLAARNLALIGLDNLPYAKQQFVRQTTGFGSSASQGTK